MTCPYLEYRSLSGGGGADSSDGAGRSGSTGGADGSDEADTGDDSRAYCTAADEFVQPMRADVCNDRYDLDHETDCEIYRDAEGLPVMPDGDARGGN